MDESKVSWLTRSVEEVLGVVEGEMAEVEVARAVTHTKMQKTKINHHYSFIIISNEIHIYADLILRLVLKEH